MTLDEIAKLAGVSKTTASYVINGKAQQYRISEKTQRKVMTVVEQYNYRPNHAASALRAGHSHSFGLIIPDLENSSYARLAKLLEQRSRKAGYQILIGCSDDDPQTEKKVAEALISRRIDTLFTASALSDANDYYLKIQSAGTPVIALDRALDDRFFSCVISENVEGAYKLADSAISSRVRSVGLIGALPKLRVSKEREQGFRLLCDEKNLPAQVLYGEHFSRKEGTRLIKQWFTDDQLPDAIITTSYTLLEGVLDVMLNFPDLMKDIKLATFGDNRLLDFLPYKINSLSQQFELIADRAMALALTDSVTEIQSGTELIPRSIVIR